MKKFLSLLLLCALCVLFACSKTDSNNTGVPGANECSGIDSHFASKVLPITQAKCATAGCHGNGSNNGPGALTNFAQLSNASVNIKNAVSSGRMPKGGSLSAQDKNAILCWINSGSPNN